MLETVEESAKCAALGIRCYSVICSFSSSSLTGFCGQKWSVFSSFPHLLPFWKNMQENWEEAVLLCLVTQLCPSLCDPMDCSPPGSSVHGILQARILEWVAMPSSRGSSQHRDRTQISCIAGRFLYHLSHLEEATFS